jgi:hypothetical protein
MNSIALSTYAINNVPEASFRLATLIAPDKHQQRAEESKKRVERLFASIAYAP